MVTRLFRGQAGNGADGRRDFRRTDGRSQCQHSNAPARAYPPDVWGFGRSVERNAVTFVSQAAQEDGIGAKLGLAKDTLAVKGTRGVMKADMKLNSATPQIEVDPETYEVRADGVLLTCEPAKELPLAQRYFLF